MTIGISINDLLEIDPWQYDNQQDLLNAILDQCTELNPWLPIEQAPKDRFLLMYSPDIAGISKKFVGKAESCWYWKPTHFCELPADPE